MVFGEVLGNSSRCSISFLIHVGLPLIALLCAPPVLGFLFRLRFRVLFRFLFWAPLSLSRSPLVRVRLRVLWRFRCCSLFRSLFRFLFRFRFRCRVRFCFRFRFRFSFLVRG